VHVALFQQLHAAGAERILFELWALQARGGPGRSPPLPLGLSSRNVTPVVSNADGTDCPIRLPGGAQMPSFRCGRCLGPAGCFRNPEAAHANPFASFLDPTRLWGNRAVR
jgi:hypothetical protein